MDCELRSWRLEDAADLAEVLNQKDILDHLRDGIPYPYTTEDAKAFITLMRSADPHKIYAFAIAADQKVVGSVGVFRQENIHARTAEIGYYVAKPYWGRGIGTMAVEQVCRTLFTHTDLIRVFAHPFAENAGSCRVLEKAGFSCEGTLRKSAVKNGRVLDMKLYALIREDE